MAALTASASTNHTASASSLMHAHIDALTASASAPLHLEEHRERFQERALREVTVNSNDRAMLLDPSNPTLVGEEMEAQKDYFRRLKFSYLEQEAKRQFLHHLMGEDPQAVQEGANEQLQASNAAAKAELKIYKAELEAMRVESIHLAQSNAKRHSGVRNKVSEVAELQKQIRDAELEIARIKATHPPDNRMTTAQANDVLDEQVVEIGELTDATAKTNEQVSARSGEVKSATKEVARLGREREKEEARAKEVRLGREAGDTKVDDLCRWLSSSIQFYRSLMGILSVRASVNKGHHLLHIEYDVPAQDNTTEGGNVELELWFDPNTRRLLDASVRGAKMDVTEAVTIAVDSNDVSGLVGQMLARLRPIPPA